MPSDDFAFTDNRMIKLRNLITLRQIRVEIVLAVEGADEVDFCFQAKTRAHSLLNCKLVDDRQHPGHGAVNE